MSFVYSQHAIDQLTERNIERSSVDHILANPQQIIRENGKAIYQGIIQFNSKQYLLRIFVNTESEPNIIITIYRTSKIKKYYEG